MGKSPGKWIKSVLFRKKSSRSSLSKGKANSVTRSANAEETLISAELPSSDVNVNPLLTSNPLTSSCVRNGEDSNFGKGPVIKSSNDTVAVSSERQDENAQTVTDLESSNHSERISQEQAVIKVQALCRGDLARRAFKPLKGIIRLQALFRGHLVRRQAVATLCCVLGIVRLQALVRGQRVRHSILSDMHEKQSSWTNPGGKSSNSFETCTSTRGDKMLKNAFVTNLLASSPTPMPLRLQYGEGKPNSAWAWLEHWTRSHVWEPNSQQKTSFDSKSQINPSSAKTSNPEHIRPKRVFKKLTSPNGENGSTHITSDSDKFKRNLKKSSSHSTEPVLEHPQNEIVKVKRNLKKVSSTTTVTSETVSEKPNCTKRKALNSVTDVSDQAVADSVEKVKKDFPKTEPLQIDPCTEKTDEDIEITRLAITDTSGEKIIDIPVTEPKLDGFGTENLREDTELTDANQIDHSPHDPAAQLKPIESNGKHEDIQKEGKVLGYKDDKSSDANQKSSRRRASLPAANHDDEENGLHNNTPRVPSYMAATQSAKAKLKMQGLPKFGDDGADKNGFTRRHSLPSLSNGKMISLSPPVQKLVQASGKGLGIRSDKSLSTSRDGTDKVVQPGWRR